MSSRTPAILFALIAMSLDALSIGLIVPVVPALVKSLAHGDAQYAPRALAIMMAAFACAQLFAAPIWAAFRTGSGVAR